MMIAHVYLTKGAIVPEHAHHNEQITYILEGRLRFFLPDETIDVGAGEVLTIPAHLPHKAEALEDTLDVDVFHPPHPPRSDWLDGSDAYLRDPA
jgi:quercetin dioxygenase-like cupin family protein